MKRKYSLLSSLIVLVVLIFGFIQTISCSQNNNGDYKKTPNDTTLTTLEFMMPKLWSKDLNIIPTKYTLEVQRITKDTLMDKQVDTYTKKLTWQRDTSYMIQIPVNQGVDSVTKMPLPPLIKTGIIPKGNIIKDYFKIFE